ncbi:MAG TPA: hypothetical protein DDX98_03980 [Bacteroidales bacterium]|jgi:transcriptional regulator with XRE-family HTH domain|nr:hypothetical protein [Bacteroidales bacterium]
MNQPELGKKVLQLRTERGLTQGDLALKCGVTSRTIQRIESNEVQPRTYTVRLIFSALDYEVYNSTSKLKKQLEQLFFLLIDLFNLKTNTMKKLMILSTPALLIAGLLLLSSYTASAQAKKSFHDDFEDANEKIVRWFNKGAIDSIANLYFEDACILPAGADKLQGKEDITTYYSVLYHQGLRFDKIISDELIITKKLIVDRGIWTMKMGDEVILGGNYISQWHYKDGKWAIENEISNYFPPGQ